MTNERSLPDRLRIHAEDIEGYPGEDMREAADEIEGAHHDIERLMTACNAEVSEAERLRAALIQIRDSGNGVKPLGLALINIAAHALAGSAVEPSEDAAPDLAAPKA